MNPKISQSRNPAKGSGAFSDNLLDKNVICTTCSTQYIFVKREPNPMYADGLRSIPRKSVNFKPKQKRRRKPVKMSVDSDSLRAAAFEFYLSKHHNVTTNFEVNPVGSEFESWMLQSDHKNLTTLRKLTRANHVLDTGEVITGEIIEDIEIVVGDLWNGVKRRDRSINAFCKHFAPKYQAFQISMFFFTLTIADQSGVEIRNILDILKKRAKYNGFPVGGYHWVLEVSDNDHVHYHVVLVTKRMHLRGKKFPEWLFLDDQWKARTQVGFVTGDVYQYCCKYLKKGIRRIVGKRMYGKSIINTKPKKK